MVDIFVTLPFPMQVKEMRQQDINLPTWSDNHKPAKVKLVTRCHSKRQ